MPDTRPYVLSIAGIDPSGGAGIFADIKTFEQHRVYGFGVCSALTVQNDTDFLQVQWLGAREIIKQLEPLVTKFKISSCKIGIVQELDVLLDVMLYLKSRQPHLQIILDPVLKASAGFAFHGILEDEKLTAVLREITLLTPNYNEIQQLNGDLSPKEAAKALAKHCAVLLKGGHNPEAPGTDYFFASDSCITLKPTLSNVSPKHGSGCVLSASVAANLALGHTLPEACRRGKRYTELFLSSNNTLFGYHNYDS
ncbi:hydroxymethylpyrimidine/phosphomethylpyrimidine kinase [Pontibacter korlensis]|uniref:hydroxymethylpyrimidine kinase n=1 Tax=Pontibacter korlensis TaxID=400092 RepID=A0A0E3UY95_9BACT|nr:hydroxymethylpyrimidine/phosphomethylpyrimidine kinase [Pontibacter korlensis]AKD04256.1 phosphomethylpyrimidine kinase [Pontibacter korlensis]